MKRYLILLSFVLLVALAACRQAPATETQPTVESAEDTLPTEAPAVDEAAPAPEEPSETTPLAHTADPALVNKLWFWERRDGATGVVEVPNPSEYNLIFNEDGTFFAQLDCNRGSGTYATPGDGSLMMQLGMTSMALCPEASLFDQMMAMFPGAAQYRIEAEGATLVIVWADGTTDTYRAEAADEPTTSGPVDAALRGKVWQWLGTITGEGALAVADSTRYLIEFLDDGTAAITADCNAVVAQYTVNGNAITLIPGPSTLVACPEDSQADVFTQQLSGAALFFFLDDDLYIDLIADSGTMHFSELPAVDLPAPEATEPTGTVNAPDGVFLRTGPGTNFPSVGAAPLGESGTLIGISQDRAWYVVEAPGLPDGRVWVSAAFVDAVNADNLPTVATPALPNALVGRTWEWRGTIVGTQPTTVADPSRYTITFAADGTASIQADCNMVMATYTVSGGALTIVPGASTMAFCPDSQDQVFVQQLTAAASHFFQNDELFVTMMTGGTMRFLPAGAGGVTVLPENPITGGITGGASGLPFRVVSFGPAGAEQPVLTGTTITATFDEAALTVSGSSGCNSFTGGLVPQGGFFTVGPIGSTLMACGAPGVMEQEAAFLAALQGTTGYRWTQSANVITSGQLTYTLADGTSGVINLVTP